MKAGVSYFGNRMVRHYVERDLPEILEAGCTFVLHTFSEYDMQFYREAVGEMVARSKQAGLEVYLDPWGLGGVFGGEAFSRFLLDHPDDWQVLADGTRVPAACLNSPAFAELLDEWVGLAAAVQPDVLFWDEPHLAERRQNWGCRCEHCRRLYAERFDEDMPTTLTASVEAFREESIVQFITRLCERGESAGLRNAVCLLPFVDAEHGLRHWERIASVPSLDVLAVTPFWHLRERPVRDFVGEWARKVSGLCDANGLEAQVWLQAFLISEGREAEVLEAAEEARRAGVRNMGAWGFRACAHMAALRPDRPEVVWDMVRQAFRAHVLSLPPEGEG